MIVEKSLLNFINKMNYYLSWKSKFQI